MASARLVPHSELRATECRLPTRNATAQRPMPARRSTSTSAPSTSAQKDSTSAAGIHGTPSRAVISLGSSWRGSTSSRAATLAAKRPSTAAADLATSSLARTLPDR